MSNNIIYTICPRCGYIGLNEDKCKVCNSTMIHTNIPMYNQIYGFDLDVEFEKMHDNYLTLQRLKHVGFLYIFTSKYTQKYIRLMSFYKTFTTKDTSVSISDSIRLVSKPIYIFSF